MLLSANRERKGNRHYFHIFSPERVENVPFLNVCHALPTSSVNFCQAHDGAVNSIDFHPSGDFLLSASDDTALKVWPFCGFVDFE